MRDYPSLVSHVHFSKWKGKYLSAINGDIRILRVQMSGNLAPEEVIYNLEGRGYIRLSNKTSGKNVLLQKEMLTSVKITVGMVRLPAAVS